MTNDFEYIVLEVRSRELVAIAIYQLRSGAFDNDIEKKCISLILSSSL